MPGFRARLECVAMSATQIELDAGLPEAPVALSRRVRWIDLVFVVGVALWQPLFSSLAHSLGVFPLVATHSNWRVVFSMFSEGAALAVLVYVLWNRGRGSGTLSRPGRWMDLPSGLALYAVTIVAAASMQFFVRYAWTALAGHEPPQVSVPGMLGMQASLVWMIFQFVNPWFEELIVRGFLMTEVSALVGVRTAIIASTLVQTSYHLYQGPVNAMAVGTIFLFYSIYFARSRRLLPIIIAHTLQDVLAFAVYAHRHV